MQKRFIDHEDYDHLINTFSGDFHQLLNRIKKIENSIPLITGGINKKDKVNVSEDWINPVSKNKWVIHYGYIRNGKKTETHFYPYTEFTITKGEKAYLLISKEVRFGLYSNKLTTSSGATGQKLDKSEEDFGDFLLKNNWALNVFRGHFFSAFRDTVQNSDFTPYQIIHEFAANRKYRLVESFVQNKKWLMYLHRGGVAFIKEHKNYLLFDTYISFDELANDQLNAIIDHLQQLDDQDYFATALHLMEGSEWIKLLDIERIKKVIDFLKRKDPILGEKVETNIAECWKEHLL